MINVPCCEVFDAKDTFRRCSISGANGAERRETTCTTYTFGINYSNVNSSDDVAERAAGG